MTQSQRIVLANFLGDSTPLPYDLHPYAKGFPGNCIITFEEDKSGRVYRVFFALYGQVGNFTAQLSRLDPQWPRSDGRATLHIVCPYEVNHCREHETQVIEAFERMAREEFAERKSRELELKPLEGGDDL